MKIERYSCHYRKVVFNALTEKKEVITKVLVVTASSKSQAKRFCKYETGVRPFRVKRFIKCQK